MGMFGDIGQGVEQGFDDVVHAGESALDEITAMLGTLREAITGAGLGSAVQELAQLAEEANALRGRLAAAADSTHWAGAAADAFTQRARQRAGQISALVGAIDTAHATVEAAYAVAGIA
ncbi:hypothetical protein KDL01_06080 [Actinospica durhamensis]|uniref:Uncharacterized protein n=1 Tax=Actinospica durhamensis TaxID=1508375 RepID=A0A941EHR9_9ACTN|nr:hypothetical protein [Actinospica durhamensis]MBR7832820.1 hypothetical protein [Actinospica durhamensis]